MSKGRSLAFQTAYAIVRVDNFGVHESPHDAEANGPNIPAGDFNIKIKEVVLSFEEAEREVDRLNKGSTGKWRRYFWQSTHLFLDGGSHGTDQNS